MVPKWCPDVKNRVVKRKNATITRYKKNLCLQGFSQITYKKICGNTGRFWLFHDPRNQVYRQRYRGFESHPLRQQKSPSYRMGSFAVFLLWVGFERRLLAVCRWHAATAVAFPQKRNPTHTTRLQDSLDHPAGEFLIMGGGRSLYCEAVNPTHSASEHRCAHILPFRKRSSQR